MGQSFRLSQDTSGHHQTVPPEEEKKKCRLTGHYKKAGTVDISGQYTRTEVDTLLVHLGLSFSAVKRTARAQLPP